MRDFKQSRAVEEDEEKQSIYTCKIFISIRLSDLVPLEHPFCSPVFALISLNFMYTAILRNDSHSYTLIPNFAEFVGILL